MSNEFNLVLRSEILNMALMLESTVNQLISVCLDIEHPNPKAISNKSGSLSFKNKLDLLNDLEIISKRDYLNLLLFMEFRNQFLHNIECTSFVKAVQFLGDDRGKQLIKLSDLGSETNQEINYIQGYKKLFESNLCVIKEIYNKRKDNYYLLEKMFNSLAEYTEFLFELNGNMIWQIMETCKPNNIDVIQVTNLKSKIRSIVFQVKEILESSETYSNLRDELKPIDIKKMEEILKWPKRKSS